ncbi:hypothetical protein ACF3NR_09100 [Vaginella massiliensis]|uniref:hypothetical protein n=1 Tax=Vaginella massiliensis TaxID=1816680 RepID=UPI0012B60830|nr:hypothetical protein [Vaginella massiliensis]
MRTLQLSFVIFVLLSILSCTDAGTLPHYKVESAVQHAYRYRTMELDDSLAKYVHNFDDTAFKKAKADFGDVNIYNLDNIQEEGSGSDKTYIATYNVEYEGAEGTEVFKVKSIDKLPKIVDYSNAIKPVVVELVDSTSVVVDSLD